MEGKTLTARVGRVENRLDKIDSRLDKKFNSIDKRFIAVDKRFDEVDKRFDGIDNQLEKMSIMLVKHDHDIKEIKERLNSIDETLKMFHKFQETLDILVGYFKDTRQEVIMMEPRFKRLESRVDTLENNLQPA